MPTSLAPYPNLEQLRKQSKDLRKAHAAGSVDAATRLQAYVGRFDSLAVADVLAAELALRDAQHTVAREHGFAGWQDMLDFVAAGQQREPMQLVLDAVDYDQDSLLPVQLLQVEPIRRPDGSRFTRIVLRSQDDRVLLMEIGEAEGMALAMGLKGEMARPLTHDLLTTCLDLLGGVVRSVVIHELRETTFLAHVVLDMAGQHKYVDARPSDSLNVAARLGAPIYVTSELMDKANTPLSALSGILLHSSQ